MNPVENAPPRPAGAKKLWNFTWYMTKVDHHRPTRLRLRLYCAPGWEDEFRYRLANLGVRSTRACLGRVDVHKPDSVVRWLQHLELPPQLSAALEGYAAACTLTKRGVPAGPDLRERQAAACRAVMAWVPQPQNGPPGALA